VIEYKQHPDGGYSKEDVVNACLLKNINDFKRMNAVCPSILMQNLLQELHMKFQICPWFSN
jgi:hypothetical protein